MTRANLLISGRVQGVAFRASTKRKAQNLGLKGWVRNTEDGKVEAVIEGSKDKIKELISWAEKGPRLANVNNIEINWVKGKENFQKFEIKH